jgi:pimeloyl-ACP methyl ester carboxylesterase
MKAVLYFTCIVFFTSCTGRKNIFETNITPAATIQKDTVRFFESGYSVVNGLKMYFEIHGEGKPLVLIHGGGSTIQTSFGRILPSLSANRKVIAVELQAHGHTNDRNLPLSFEQDADDVSTLLRNLKIKHADFFGFSNGGNTALQIAIRHPEIVDRVIVGSAFYKRSGVYDQFWEFMNHATLEQMPQPYKDAYAAVAPDPDNIQSMHDKCVRRMVEFKDWKDSDIQSISAPTLLIVGDEDMVRPEHAVEMYRLIPHCKLAILPGGHGEYMGEITALSNDNKGGDFIVPMIESFLDEKVE